ncbi:hypothetical protein Gotur_019727 [Gossypium turneri]
MKQSKGYYMKMKQVRVRVRR